MRTSWGRPNEAALMQSSRAKPDANAIVDEHLQPVATLVGKEVGMVGMCGPEDDDHARQH